MLSSIKSSDVRAELGSPSSDLLSDSLLTRIIEDETTLYGSAARAANILYRHFSLEADKKLGYISIQYSNRAELWKEIAEDMEHKSAIYGATPYAGGISLSDKDTVEDDSDYPDTFFDRDMFMDDDVDDY